MDYNDYFPIGLKPFNCGAFQLDITARTFTLRPAVWGINYPPIVLDIIADRYELYTKTVEFDVAGKGVNSDMGAYDVTCTVRLSMLKPADADEDYVAAIHVCRITLTCCNRKQTLADKGANVFFEHNPWSLCCCCLAPHRYDVVMWRR